MDAQERKNIIIASKCENRIITGNYIDLHPCASEHGEAIVRLRNQERSRYSMNRKVALTIEEHNKWYEGYTQRSNDIYWCIYDKKGDMIGVIRIYDIIEIDINICYCNQGGLIIDEAYAMKGPYTLETELITLDYCFYTLQVDKVLNDNRVENKNMNSISRRIGFQNVEIFERNGAEYYLYELVRKNYKRTDLERILNKWIERDNCQ